MGRLCDTSGRRRPPRSLRQMAVTVAAVQGAVAVQMPRDGFRALVSGIALPPGVDADFLFSMLDTNGSGLVSAREFWLGFAELFRGKVRERLRYLFEIFDALFNYGEELARATTDAAAAFATVNQNGDGTISFDEFAAWSTANGVLHDWLADLGAACGDKIASLRGAKERELRALELTRIEFHKDAAEGGGLGGEHGGSFAPFAPANAQPPAVVTAGQSEAVTTAVVADVAVATGGPAAGDTRGSDRGDNPPFTPSTPLPHPSFSSSLGSPTSTTGGALLGVAADSSPFIIDHDALSLEVPIGEGAHAVVWRGRWLMMPVAIKVFHSLPDAADEDDENEKGATGASDDDVRDDDSSDSGGGSGSSGSDGGSGSSGNSSSGGKPPRAGATTSASRHGRATSSTIGWSAPMLQACLAEVAVLSALRHPNLLLYMGCAVQPHKPLCIVSELFPGGSLHTYLHGSVLDGSGRGADADHDPLVLGRGIARGLLYLHSRGILHCDLTSQNVLVRGTHTVIADFGLSSMLRGPVASAGSDAAPSSGGGSGSDDSKGGDMSGAPPPPPLGTLCTMAPEVMNGEPYTSAADVFSFGVLLWELYTRRKPWKGLRPVQILFKVGVEGARLPLPANLPPPIAALLRECWAEDPAERPSLSHILRTLDGMDG